MAAAPPSKLETKTVETAIDALLKWRESKSKQEKPQLLAQDEFIYLVIALKKLPAKGRVNAYKVPLPTPLYGPESEICLIIDDRSKSNLTKEDAQKKVKSDEIIGVSKLLKVSKLRSDYRPHEAKRKLCDSYDLFLADNRAIPVMPKLLGKHFYRKRKHPVPVDLRHKDWKSQIERACSSALFYLRTGTCCTLRVARGSMDRDEIVCNVMAAIDGAVEIIPKKWGNVRALHLKFQESVALPVYEAYPDVVLKISGIEEEKAKSAEKSVKASKNASDGENDAKEGKSGSKKGRISEVRYMDNSIDDVLMEGGELVSDDDIDVSEDEKPQIEVKSTPETENKKRKKRDSTPTKQDVVSESKGKKGSKKVAVEVKEDHEKPKKDELPVKGEEKSARRSKRVAIEVKGDDAKPKKGGLSAKAIEKPDGKSKKVAADVIGAGAKRKKDGLTAKPGEVLDDGKSKKVKKELGKLKSGVVEIMGKKKKPVSAAWK